MKKFFISVLLLFCISASASELDNLDQAPEGAHAKQMLLMGFVSLGMPFGSLIDAENNFIKNSTYRFSTSDTTKRIDLTSLAVNYGLSFEYMPIDYLGIKIRLKSDTVVERTRFGSEYKNWSETLISSYSVSAGLPVHLTLRKRWDISLVPYAGYFTAEIYPVPVGSDLLTGFTGPAMQSASGLLYGSELVFIYYFSGGFTLSAGADWCFTSISLPQSVKSHNPETLKDYTSSKDLSYHNISFIISAGYAFEN